MTKLQAVREGYVEQAIREAFDQGWGQNMPPYEHKFVRANMYWSVWLDANGSEYTLPISQHLMDPEFWKCLGRVRDREKIFCTSSGREVPVYHGQEGQVKLWWLYQMHHLIDRLAEGKDIESFFEQLLTNNT